VSSDIVDEVVLLTRGTTKHFPETIRLYKVFVGDRNLLSNSGSGPFFVLLTGLDWLEGQVLPTGAVTLRGQVTRPTLKSEAEKRVKSIESVTEVVNEIEVLPASPNDDQIRLATYRALYSFDSPLFQYAMRAVPPIHILVKGGRVTLKGVVMNQMDRQLAETAARGVPNTFEVTNELIVEGRTD